MRVLVVYVPQVLSVEGYTNKPPCLVPWYLEIRLVQRTELLPQVRESLAISLFCKVLHSAYAQVFLSLNAVK